MRASPESFTRMRRNVAIIRPFFSNPLMKTAAREPPFCRFDLGLETGLGGNFRREVRSLFLLDALAEGIADEGLEGHRLAGFGLCFLEHLGHGLGRIANERLLQEGDFLEIALQAVFDDLLLSVTSWPKMRCHMSSSGNAMSENAPHAAMSTPPTGACQSRWIWIAAGPGRSPARGSASARTPAANTP